ncbi:MAG: NTP transferase domain-containing protein [Candidatus Hydrogenedens sp.]|jgi:mannose-1-phosphate guanylyltransferase|nr:NTP transferase domain-containing protein [Candidatus Hydrogenedens sp.]
MTADFSSTLALVLAGGSGERFWPLSRPERPKQLLDLDGSGKCLLRLAVDHLKPLIAPDQIYISTNSLLAPAVREVLEELPEKAFLAEPSSKNTGGALVYTLARLLAERGEEACNSLTLAIITADQKIERRFCFHKMLREAVATAQKEEALVLCGIMPARAETGFGYIEIVRSLVTGPGKEKKQAWPVKAFHEKPDTARARRFVSSGKHFWNSGMIFCRFSVFMKELERVQPPMAALVHELARLFQKNQLEEASSLFSTLEAISIDHALLEHAKKLLMVRGSFSWRDMGTWHAVAEERTADNMGNVTVGESIALDCRDSVIWNASEKTEMTVAALGLSDIVFVVTDDAILAMHKDHAGDLRKVLDELKVEKKEEAE